MTRFIFGLGLMLFTSGCLDCEFLDVKILRNQGEPSIIISDAVNVYSDETDSERVEADFYALVNMCQEEFAKALPQDGMILQGCETLIQDGKIVLRSVGLIDHLPAGNISVTDTHLVWKWEESDGQIVETNGEIVPGKHDTLIFWPKDARELHVKLRTSDPAPEAHKPVLELLREYLRPRS